jgi:uncharacterized protein (TIGR02611 family)
MMRLGRRIGIAIAGSVVMAAGVIMLAIPGPGVVTIVLGIAILSQEFERPRIWLRHLRERGVKLSDYVLRKLERPRLWFRLLKERAVKIKDKVLRRRPESGGD